MMRRRERVIVALSGGVDSSVAAALLLEEGYEVIGSSLQFLQCEEGVPRKSCCGADSLTWARSAAARLGIPHYVIDCRTQFEEKVLRRAWEEYAHGRTPNPCVLCNKELKFGLLLEHALRLGANRLATGHHARLLRDDEQGSLKLLRGKDPRKDQSYFLFCLSERQLGATLLPVGHMTKDEVRSMARAIELPNADRAESQDACLGLGEDGFAEALRQRFGADARPGAIVDEKGRALGAHSGIHKFTIGQRRGLGVAVGRPAYVVDIVAERREVVVASDERILYASGLVASGVVWQLPLAASGSMEVEVQIRYRHAPAKALAEWDEVGAAVVRFAEPQRAVTPGQAVVFYRGNRVLGGGWIEQALRP